MWAHLIMDQHSVQLCPYHQDYTAHPLLQLADFHVFMLLLWACPSWTMCSCHQLTTRGGPSILLLYRLALCSLHHMRATEHDTHVLSSPSPWALSAWPYGTTEHPLPLPEPQ